MALRFIDFCAGIGAGRLGLERHGLQCVAYSEINEKAVTSYKLLHDTGSEIECGDLTKINGDTLPQFDIMIAGFPCQTFSIVGKRKGFDDERGQIIYSLIKLLKTKNIPYFIFENVKGLVNHDKGRTIEVIVKTLDDAGYDVEFKVLNSLNYGVPQMRERVYFIGVRKDLVLKEKRFDWPREMAMPDIKNYLVDDNNVISENVQKTLERYLNNKYNKGEYTIRQLLENEYSVLDTRQSDLRIYTGKVPTLRTGRKGILYVRDGKLRSLTGYESLLLQGFDREYAEKIRDRVSESTLLAQTGNAMTVTVVDALCKSLLDYVVEGK